MDGQSDPALASEGRAQAELVAARLAAAGIDAIYVSTLRRTAETAAPLAARLGLVPQVEAGLREVGLGEWEGGLFRKMVSEHHPMAMRMWAEETFEVIPGAERAAGFAARVRDAVGRLAAAHTGQRVALFTHGGVIGQVLALASGSRPFAFVTVGQRLHLAAGGERGPLDRPRLQRHRPSGGGSASRGTRRVTGRAQGGPPQTHLPRDHALGGSPRSWLPTSRDAMGGGSAQSGELAAVGQRRRRVGRVDLAGEPVPVEDRLRQQPGRDRVADPVHRARSRPRPARPGRRPAPGTAASSEACWVTSTTPSQPADHGSPWRSWPAAVHGPPPSPPGSISVIVVAWVTRTPAWCRWARSMSPSSVSSLTGESTGNVVTTVTS